MKFDEDASFLNRNYIYGYTSQFFIGISEDPATCPQYLDDLHNGPNYVCLAPFCRLLSVAEASGVTFRY